MVKTSGILRPFLELFFSSEENIYWANVLIRKLAHLSYYALLAFLVFFSLSGISVEKIRRNWFWLSFAAVFIIASLDEIHQAFEPSRVGSLSDVLLDCAGGFIMLVVIKVFTSFIKNNR